MDGSDLFVGFAVVVLAGVVLAVILAAPELALAWLGDR